MYCQSLQELSENGRRRGTIEKRGWRIGKRCEKLKRWHFAPWIKRLNESSSFCSSSFVWKHFVFISRNGKGMERKVRTREEGPTCKLQQTHSFSHFFSHSRLFHPLLRLCSPFRPVVNPGDLSGRKRAIVAATDSEWRNSNPEFSSRCWETLWHFFLLFRHFSPFFSLPFLLLFLFNFFLIKEERTFHHMPCLQSLLPLKEKSRKTFNSIQMTKECTSWEREQRERTDSTGWTSCPV